MSRITSLIFHIVDKTFYENIRLLVQCSLKMVPFLILYYVIIVNIAISAEQNSYRLHSEDPDELPFLNDARTGTGTWSSDDYIKMSKGTKKLAFAEFLQVKCTIEISSYRASSTNLVSNNVSYFPCFKHQGIQ